MNKHDNKQFEIEVQFGGLDFQNKESEVDTRRNPIYASRNLIGSYYELGKRLKEWAADLSDARMSTNRVNDLVGDLSTIDTHTVGVAYAHVYTALSLMKDCNVRNDKKEDVHN